MTPFAITSVRLEDFKSYQDVTIPLHPGVTTICGANGAGKTSILEAIGFALFGFAPYPQAQMVREGQKSGKVSVTVQSALDGQTYVVRRSCGERGQHSVYTDQHALLVQGNKETMFWLQQHSGVNAADDMQRLFVHAIGVPQGSMSQAFLDSDGAARRRLFDPLLRVDMYDQAWQDMRQVDAALRERQTATAIALAKLEPLMAQYSVWKQQTHELTATIQVVQQQQYDEQYAVQIALGDYRACKSAFEQEQQIHARLQHLQDQILDMHKHMESLRLASAQSQPACTAAATHERAAAKYKQAEQRLAQIQRDWQQHRQALLHIQQALDEYAAAEVECSRLEKLQQRIKGSADRLSRMSDVVTHWHEQEAMAMQLPGQERQLRLFQEQQRSTKQKAQQSIATDTHTQDWHSTAQKTDTVLHSALQQYAAAHAWMDALEQRPASVCPDGDAPDLEEWCAWRWAEAWEEWAGAGRQVSALHSTLMNARQQSLLQPTSNQTASQQLAEQTLAALAHDCQSVADAIQMSTQARDWLHSQSGQRRVYDQDVALVADSHAVQEQMHLVQHRIAELDRQYAQHQEARMRVQELEDEREHWSGVLSDESAAYTAWQQAMQIVTAAQAGQERLRNIEQAQDELFATIGVVQHTLQYSQLDEAKAEVDEAESHWQEAHTRQVQTATRLKLLSEQLDQIEQALREVAHVPQELAQQQRCAAEHTRDRACAESVRAMYKLIGPRITQVYIDTISSAANTIFADIVDDGSSILRWDNTYAIALEQQGRIRQFKQLSGGEQIVAALAVRLALIQHISRIGMAFFDEPTIHLDLAKRMQLAAHIRRIRGFHQLFVISHDDTFEQDTDWAVRVSKERGLSTVSIL